MSEDSPDVKALFRRDLEACVMACYDSPDFMREYARLRGVTDVLHPGARGGIGMLVDEATGRRQLELLRFVEFVYRYVYLPLHVARQRAEAP